MDLWLWSLYFLPVSGALRVLPEIKLEGVLGGSIVIECPLPETPVRLYLCRTMALSGTCTTVVSNKNFVLEEFKHRVTLELCPDRKLFLVEVTELTERDSGVYACGVGMNTNRGKTQQVTLTVHSDYRPFWEEDPMPEPPAWFNPPPWFKTPAYASPFEFIPKETSPSQRTKAPPAHHTSPTTSVTHHPRVSKASSVATAEPTTLLPPTTALKTSARETLLRPQTASYNHQTRLHRQSSLQAGPPTGSEDARPGSLPAATHIAESAHPKCLQCLPSAPSGGGRCWSRGGTSTRLRSAGDLAPSAGD
uniref:Fc mu receptor n=1 Tax=Sus scrofa TaxID=9823 RepID=A0A5G2RCZ3_PIG